MKKPERRINPNNGRANLGILFIIVGGVFILNILNILPYYISNIIFSWQMLLIAIGVFNIINKKFTPAIILITLGSIFLIPEFIHINYSLKQLFWPIALVIVGIVLILRNNRGLDRSRNFKNNIDDHFKKQGDISDFIDHASLFGGNKIMYASQNFKGGRVTSIFGGSEINFHNTELENNTATIDVFTMFGGSEFIVPQDWNVQIDVVAIFGGFTDKRYLSAEPFSTDKTLIIKGFTIFGGGKVKN